MRYNPLTGEKAVYRTDLSDRTIAAFGSLIFGGLMLGRLISGFISNRLGDRRLIRIGIAVELLGILMVFLPAESYVVTAVGFVVIGTGMGPVYPAIQHMAPTNIGMRYSAAIIGLQMASAYIGSTFILMVFRPHTTGCWHRHHALLSADFCPDEHRHAGARL